MSKSPSRLENIPQSLPLEENDKINQTFKYNNSVKYFNGHM